MMLVDEPIKADERPAAFVKQSPVPAGSGSLQKMTLGRLLGIARKRWLWIVGGAATGVVVLGAVNMAMPRKFTSTVELYLDPRELQILDRDLTKSNQDSTGYATVVASQKGIITSTNVLTRVVEILHLDHDSEFTGGESNAISPQAAAVDTLSKHIVVAYTERSYIIGISVSSTDPDKAAKIANTLASSYLSEATDSRSYAAHRVTGELSARLSELEKQLRDSENKVEAYKLENHLTNIKDVTMADQQISDTNQQYAAAKARAVEAQARYDQIIKLNRQGIDSSTLPEVLASQTISSLRAQAAEARRKLAELQNELGPRHPAYRAALTQYNDIQHTISEEINRYIQSSKGDLARAKENEAAMAAQLDKMTHQGFTDNKAMVGLRELEREANANRTIYESFLSRARETQQEDQLTISNARIIGEAMPPRSRASPPSLAIFAILGAALGGLAGMCAAIFADAASPAGGQATTSPALTKPQQPVEVEEETEEEALPIVRPMRSKRRKRRQIILPLWRKDVDAHPRGTGAVSKTASLSQSGLPMLRNAHTAAMTKGFDQLYPLLIEFMTQAGALTPVLAIEGPNIGEIRSIAALNLALAATATGLRVLLVDADHEEQALTTCFDAASFIKKHSLREIRRRAQSKQTKPSWFESSEHVCLRLWSQDDSTHTLDHLLAELTAADQSEPPFDLVILDGPIDRALLRHSHAFMATMDDEEAMADLLESTFETIGAKRENDLLGIIVSEVTQGNGTFRRRYA